MQRVLVLLGVVCVVVSAGALAMAGADEEGEAKYNIKEIMKQAHKEKLLNKVMEGGASQEDKSKLLDLYLSLLENTPKKGEEDSWHAKAGAVVIAAAKVAVGRGGAEAELKTATNCAECHKAHK